MFNTSQQLEKSRLGRLLVNRGYINEPQLQLALTAQRDSGRRLGEILIEQGLISQKELNRTLKHQSRYRYTAAFIAVVATPFQPMIAMAASPVAQASSEIGSMQLKELEKKGLQPMDEFEMESVSARGINEDYQNLASLVDGQNKPDGVKTLVSLSKLVFPIWQFLDADMTIKGVHYGPEQPLLTADGAINVQLPTLIEEINIDNIHVVGDNSSSFGSISMSGIHFNNASLTIRPQ